MSRRLSTLVGLMLLVLVAASWYRSRALSDRPPAIRPKIVVVTGGTNPYWQSIGKGAAAGAVDFNAIVDVRMPDNEDVEDQSRILLNVQHDATDALAVSPLNAEEQTRIINQLADAMLVITIDSDAPLSNRLSYVGASNVAAGQQCAKLVKEALPNGGKLAVLLANLTKSNTLERRQGFDETLRGLDPPVPADVDPKTPVYEVVDYLVDEGDAQRCEQQLRELLSAHDDLAGIVGMNAYHGPILVKVLKDTGRLNGIKLVTFDTLDETLAGIEAGDIYATIAQDPYEYGYEAIRLLTSYCRRRDQQTLPPPGVKSTMTISTNAVRKDSVASLRASLSGRPAESDHSP